MQQGRDLAELVARGRRTTSKAPGDCRGACARRERRRSPGRARGSPPGAAAAPAPARAPARRRARAAPPGTSRARRPGGRCDRGPASAAPTAARGTGCPRAPTRSAGASSRCSPSASATSNCSSSASTCSVSSRRASALNHAVPLRPCSAGPRQSASADATESAAADDVAVAQRGARLREQLLEPDRIHARALERVPVGRADDRLLTERRAKAGDVMMERVPRSGRKLLPPQAVDRASRRRRSGRCRSASIASSAWRFEPPTSATVSPASDLERAEQPDIEQLLQACCVSSASLARVRRRHPGARRPAT